MSESTHLHACHGVGEPGLSDTSPARSDLIGRLWIAPRLPFGPTVVSIGVLLAVTTAVPIARLSRVFLDGIVGMFLSSFRSLRRIR
jgi:hypothetical protein